MLKFSKKKNGLLVLASITLVIVASFAIFSKSSFSDNLNSQKTSSTSSKTMTNPTLKSLINDLDEYEFSKTELSNVWWVSEDNWSISIDESEAIGMVRPFTQTELQEGSSEINKIIESIDSFFKSQGFTLNKQNTSNNKYSKSYYDYVQGYENGSNNCLLRASRSTGYYENKNGVRVNNPNITVTCFTRDHYLLNYNEQVQFLKILNTRNETVSIRGNNGQAAKVGVHPKLGSGYYALFVKLNNSWRVIYEGQDIPTCSLLDQYNFPKEIHDLCSDIKE